MDHSVKSHIRWSLGFIKHYWLQLGIYLITEVFSLASTLFFIWMSKQAIDSAQHGNAQDVTTSLYWVVISLITSFITSLLGNRLNERTKAAMLINLQNQITSHQMNAKWKQTSDWHTGDILVRMNVDSQETIQLLGNVWISVIITIIKIIASLSLLYWMDPLLALLLVGICPLIILSKSFFKRLRKLTKTLKEQEGELGKVLQENFRNRLFIRSVNWESLRWDKVQKNQESIYLKKLKLLDFSTFSKGTLGIVMQLSYLVTFIWGVNKLHSAEITFGTMSAFLQLVGRIQGPLITLMNYVPLLVRSRTSLDRVMDVLQVDVEERTQEDKLDFIDRISLKNITFRYNNETLLNDVNMEFHKGQPVAVFGPSGKGKSTLLRIIMGLFPPEEGCVKLHKGNLELFMKESYRCNFAYVPQGDKLLSGTIRENLVLSHKFHKANDIREALILACADFVFELPNGIDTIVGEGGYGLSEGQAQRIGIARAILQGSNVWLFDEITSSLDEPTSLRLVTNLIEKGRDKIVVFVTHDKILSRFCNSIYKMG